MNELKEASNKLTVTSNWVDQDFTTLTHSNTNDSYELKSNVNSYYVQTYPNYFGYWNYSWAPKIQLKLSEITKLQKIAKDRPDIKEILNKFTTHIEVLVDF